MRENVWAMHQLFISAVVLLFAAQVRAEVRYIVSDLGTLGGLSSEAYGINASGEVVGESTTSGGGGTHAFLYSNGVMTDLGAMGYATSRAFAINSSGQVIGNAFTPRAGGVGFVFDHGNISILPTLGGSGSTPYGINNIGQIVGNTSKLDVFGNDDGPYSFIYGNGQIKELLGSGGYLRSPNGINTSGQVIGLTFDNLTGFHAALYSGGEITTLLQNRSIAYSINDHGDLVGRDNDIVQAFVYSDGKVNYLDMDVAYSINNTGDIVGEIARLGEPERAALCIYGNVTDLNDLIDPSSGWFLRSATGISDGGQISGFGTNRFGQNHAFLLTPIPEPLSFGWCVFGLALMRRRRQC